MKKLIILFFILSFIPLTLFAQATKEEHIVAPESFIFVDSASREVVIPKNAQKTAPSGAVATMFLSSFAPEKMCTVSGHITKDQQKYLPKVLSTLPETGQMYGSKATLNLETLLESGAELVIDVGDYKKGIEEDLNALSDQIGIPVIFIEGDILHMASAFRSLGIILNMEERGETLASFVEETIAMLDTINIPPEERVRVMYSSTSDGLGTNSKGSTQAQVLDLVEAENAINVEKVSNKGGGNVINMETVLSEDPEVIIYADKNFKDTLKNSPWQEVSAVKNNRCYQIPLLPYNWMGNPPSINMLLGVWWLGPILYPDYYTYNVKEKVKEIYFLLWSYELTDEELFNLLGY